MMQRCVKPCGQEECAEVHMVQSGHDFQERAGDWDHWGDTFDDGMRAACVLLIQMGVQPPSWLPRRIKRRLRRGAYPWAYLLLERARVDRYVQAGTRRDHRPEWKP